jgi:hypothetical protein
MRTELALIRSLLAAELATGYSGVGLFAKHGTLHHSCYLLNCYSCGHPSLQQDGVPTVKRLHSCNKKIRNCLIVWVASKYSNINLSYWTYHYWAGVLSVWFGRPFDCTILIFNQYARITLSILFKRNLKVLILLPITEFGPSSCW